MARTGIRVLTVAALAAGAVVLFVVLTGGSPYTHRLTVTVPEATNVISGQQIRLAGSQVGEVTGIKPVDKGRAAELELLLGDEAWPLPKGSKMLLRWGGTVNFANRYIALEPAERSDAGVLAEGAAFPSADFTVPVEFDGLLRTFPATARADLKDFLEQAGATFSRGREGLEGTLDEAPAALTEGSFVLRDLEAKGAALTTLVQSGDRVLASVQASEPDVRALLDGAGTTFDAIADEAGSLQTALEGAPSTLANARDTLARADGTLVQARTLAGRLAPGITELRRTAGPLDDVLETVQVVGPDAEATLATVRRTTPDLNPLLGKLTVLSPQIESIGVQAVENLKCIRPFTPELTGFASNWGDFHNITDGKDKIIRATVQNYGPAFSNVMSINSAQAAEQFPQLRYGFPRPPGFNAGQPWFLPECGAGKEALDPKLDPEARFTGVLPPTLRSMNPIPEGTE